MEQKQPCGTTPAWMTALVAVLRIGVGAVFILSGFAKAVDPWGTIYKISEYLSAWEWSIPHGLIVLGAISLASVEFLCGVMTLLGCYRRSVIVVMLAMMAFMLPLTLYIYIADPVADCGCFGDIWHISNLATFLKNIAITAALVALLLWNVRVRPYIAPAIQWIGLVVTLIYSMSLSYYSYIDQPPVDFRSFPPGSTLTLTEQEEEQAAQAGYDFVYERNGVQQAFDITQLPDSSWTFVERRIRAGSEEMRSPLSIFNADGDDVTEDVLLADGEQIILTVSSIASADISNTYYINKLYDYASANHIDMICLISGGDQEAQLWQDLAMADYPVYNADILQIEELARGDMGIVILRDGVVRSKHSVSVLFDTLFQDSDNLDPEQLRLLMDEDPAETTEDLKAVTICYLIVLAVIIFLNQSIRALINILRPRF